MEPELKSLKIDRSKRDAGEVSPWAKRWIIGGVVFFLLLGGSAYFVAQANSAPEVEVVRVLPPQSAATPADDAVLNATGYIVAAHKIEVASKVMGRVAWIGAEKGDKVHKGQVLARLEDTEYRAQLQQAEGQLASLQARLAELEAGSRPQEIERARHDLEEARAELSNSKVQLERITTLATEGVMAKQALDEAQAKYDRDAARVASLQRTLDLVRIGPRAEQIAAMRGQVEQARGAVAFARDQLENTRIKAPVPGTILERIVEVGEFVTTSFVGERGAKGYVVSLADLSDIEVELDINQNDFAKLTFGQKGVVTTDAFPDRKYEGVIDELSPEANRQKATVGVKVQILNPDEYLRPEMNASVAFLRRNSEVSRQPQRPAVTVPASAVRDGAVFVVHDGRAERRPVKVAGSSASGVQIESGLQGGEDLIANPPAELKSGDRIRRKEG
jgi:HlyD family secretion protein